MVDEGRPTLPPAPPGEPPPSATVELVRRRLEIVERLTPAVLVGDDPDDVHDLRVATRRLQQALDAFFAKPRSHRLRTVRRRLRRLRRALGEWRNADVLLGIVEERRKRTRSERRRASFVLLESHLTGKRRREIRRARRRILRLDCATIGDDVDRLLEEPMGGSGASAEERLAAGIVESWHDWESARVKAEGERRTEDVHALRIAAKRLRYRLELAVELGEERWKTGLSWLKSIQQRLGDWHDRQVLHMAMAEAFSRPAVFLGASALVRVALSEIEADHRRDAEDLDAVFEGARQPPASLA